MLSLIVEYDGLHARLGQIRLPCDNCIALRRTNSNREKASLAAGCGSLTPMAENTSPNPKLKYNLYYIIKLFHIYQTPN
jgi:hypothetical protein